MGEKSKDQSTERRILETAKQVFFKKGYAGARMQDIADEAGINKAMLHYYFRSKDKLFEMIFAEASSKFIPKIHVIIESEMTLFEKIEQFVSEYITILTENPFIPMFILNEFHKNASGFFETFMGNEKAPPVKKFAGQIASDIKNGIIKPIDPLQLLLNIISLCIFPFVGQPMFQLLAGVNDTQFKKLMEQRKTEVAKFIIDAIKP